MSHHQLSGIALLFALCLVACVSSAPTADSETSSTTAAPPTTAASVAASAPTTPAAAAADAEKDANATTASMAVSSSLDHLSHINNTSFTCYNRTIGYYADVENHCRVYHFCMLGNYNGQEVYQRVSYLCLNETVFDQQALDCVEAAKMSATCEESEKHYDASNSILRKAIMSSPTVDSEGGEPAANATSADSTMVAPSTTTAVPAAATTTAAAVSSTAAPASS